MAKRKVRKNTKQSRSRKNEPEETEAPVENEEDVFQVERQCAAIRALRDVETEQLRTRLRLFRSYLKDEDLQVPVLQFFEENVPNLSIVKSTDHGQYEMQWKNEDGDLTMNKVNAGSVHVSLLHRLSMVYPNCSAPIPSFGGFEFSNKSVKSSFFGVETMQIRDLVLEEPSNNQALELPDALQTPGASSQRWSIGTAPKTIRLPKLGEMLLSVHGSPLGVYKEDNMETIQETEDG